MPKYRLTKLSDNIKTEDVIIPEGDVIEGDFFLPPTEGTTFVFYHGQRARMTSTVKKIIDETTFKTNNSTYKLERI